MSREVVPNPLAALPGTFDQATIDIVQQLYPNDSYKLIPLRHGYHALYPADRFSNINAELGTLEQMEASLPLDSWLLPYIAAKASGKAGRGRQLYAYANRALGLGDIELGIKLSPLLRRRLTANFKSGSSGPNCKACLLPHLASLREVR